MTLVGEREAFEECVFLGLRLREGVSVDDLRRGFGQEVLQDCEAAVSEMVEGEIITADNGRWRLTSRGRMISTEVFGRLLMSRKENAQSVCN